MTEIPLKTYCALVGMTRQGVYKRIKAGKLNQRKDSETGRVFILINEDEGLDDVKQYKEPQNPDQANEQAKEKEITELKSLINEYKQIISVMEKKNQDIISDKTNQVNELREELKKLRSRPLFKRIFNVD